MLKSEQTYCKVDDTKGIGNRIVFQLDLMEDKMRYCLWTDSSDEDRTEDSIQDFLKSLHNCNIVHPEDLDTCYQILQKQANGLATATSEIRLYRGGGGYPWYRMYTISVNDAQGRMISINGMLEEIQNNTAKSHRSKEQAKQDSLFRKAVTHNSILSLSFDCVTGKRLISDMDVIPHWMPKDINLRNVSYSLFSRAVHTEDQHKLESLFEQNLERGATLGTTAFYFDSRFQDLSRQTQNFHWYRVFHAFIRNSPKQTTYFYLTITDIHETKMKEQQLIEQSMYDHMTHMLNRGAFENKVTHWLQSMKNATEYSFLCAAILFVENPIEINNRFGRAYLTERVSQLGKTVKAFIHPHEMCCRYGLSEFAMVLAGDNRETMDERLKMLQVVCNAHKADNPSVHILLGYYIVTTMDADQEDLFLEKAYQTLMNARHAINDGQAVAPSNQYAGSIRKNRKTESTDLGFRTAKKQTSHRVFIRTFGHFDVFVDGEAVLFNHPKAKELFALLVDRRGGFVSASEAISCLWEDEPANKTTLARCRKAAMQMKQTLTKYGAEMIIETINGKRRVFVDQCDCDIDQDIDQSSAASPRMIGTYMSEYSWAENSIAIEDK